MDPNQLLSCYMFSGRVLRTLQGTGPDSGAFGKINEERLRKKMQVRRRAFGAFGAFDMSAFALSLSLDGPEELSCWNRSLVDI